MSTDVIGDARVASALRASVRVIVPVLEVLADSDPFGIKKRTFSENTSGGRADAILNAAASVFDATDTPGTKAWESMSVDDRVSWWVRRVGGIGTIAVAFPGMFGVLARRLPLQDVLAVANQAIVLVAAGREFGVTDRDQQVRMLAAVLFGRDIDPAAGTGSGAGARIEEPDTSDAATDARSGITGLVGALWSVAKVLRGVTDELDKRPHSRSVYRWLGNIPVVGAVAGYLGERGALSRAAKAARTWSRSAKLEAAKLDAAP